MEAMVELPPVTTVAKTTDVKDRIACWLRETAGSDEAAVRTATLHLEAAQRAPKFLLCLLELAAGEARQKGVRVTAATYLKNFVRAHWSSEGATLSEEKLEFRNQLLDVLLRVDESLVLKLLAETFRIITIHDFAKQKTWSELLPALKIAVEKVVAERVADEKVAVEKDAAVEIDAVEEGAVEKDALLPKMAVEEDIAVEIDAVEEDAVEKDAFLQNMVVEKDVVSEKVAIIEDVDRVNRSEVSSGMKTLNCLLGLQTITKPFQYFLNPTMAHEPVPEPLEMIAKELLVPLHGLFHQLVQQVASSKAEGYSQQDTILLAFCKAMDLALKSHMPSALLDCIDQWLTDLLSLLDSVVLETAMDTLEHEPRLKIWKRTLQICCNLVSRHRLHVGKFIPLLAEPALAIAGQSVNAKNLNQMQQRIISLGFDLVSNILETEAGWKLISPHFPSLLDKAIFPALMMNEKDHSDWVEEEEEYVQKNLPSNMDEANGWTEDLLTPRQSALNLLGTIALTKGCPPVRKRKKAAPAKRRKVAAKGKEKSSVDQAGDLLVMPYLNQFPLPADGADLRSDEVLRYYGVMVAFGGLQRYLKTQPAAKITMLLERRVFPLYLMVAPSPYVLANANWMLGQLSRCLPEELNDIVFTALLKALVAPNAGSVSWWPVRASAAAALASLLQDGYKPVHWLPLLQATVAGVRMQEDREATMALQLLATVAETGRESVAPHVPAISAVVQVETCKHFTPLSPEPWRQVVELGFSALAALAKAWESAEPEEDAQEPNNGKGNKVFLKWKLGCTAVAITFAELLQQAWLLPLQAGAPLPVKPSPSCLSDASVLVAAILRYAQSVAEVQRMRIEPLLRVWANLIADWSAWGEHEDKAVFGCIDELVELQERCPILQFSATQLPPATSEATPQIAERPILDCTVTFLTTAIASAFSTACWRACRHFHDLVHLTQFSPDGGSFMPLLVPRFCEVAARRLQGLTSVTVPLAKPLLLVIAVGFISFPAEVDRILQQSCCEEEENHTGLEGGDAAGLLRFAEALARLAESEADPGLGLESELKIAVIGLEKIIVHIINKDMLQNQKAFSVAHHCMRSLLEVMVDLKDVAESSGSESDDDDDEDGSGSSSAESDSGSSDDDEDVDSINDSGSDAATHEETEEEFLERYAQTARDLQDEAYEEAENGQTEDGHELALGVMGFVDIEKQVLAFLKEHGKKLSSKQAMSRILLARFRDQYPKARGYL